MRAADHLQSASPSSTLPPAALSTPVSSTGYATETSSTGISYVDHHGGVSPRSLAGSATSTAYTGNIPARVISPHSQKPLATIPGAPDVRVPLPLAPHEASGQQWPGSSSHHMAASQQYQQHQHQQQLGNHAQGGRGSWDMASFIDNHAATAGGGTAGSTPSMGYRNANSNATANSSASATSNSRNAADNAVVVGGENRIVRDVSLSKSHQMHMPRT